MKISLGIGVIAAIIGGLTGLILNDWSMTVKICGYMGGGCLALVGLLNGAFISGDRNRANYHIETKDTRQEKERITNSLLMISAPNIIVAILTYIFG
ncbi:DUF5316 domain-containing protein [Syntrophomonas curvata]